MQIYFGLVKKSIQVYPEDGRCYLNGLVANQYLVFFHMCLNNIVLIHIKLCNCFHFAEYFSGISFG